LVFGIGVSALFRGRNYSARVILDFQRLRSIGDKCAGAVRNIYNWFPVAADILGLHKKENESIERNPSCVSAESQVPMQLSVECAVSRYGLCVFISGRIGSRMWAIG